MSKLVSWLDWLNTPDYPSVEFLEWQANLTPDEIQATSESRDRWVQWSIDLGNLIDGEIIGLAIDRPWMVA